jgi:hypothetical protein
LVKLFTQIVPPDTLSIHADSWNYLGDFKVSVYLSDTGNKTKHDFKLTITNSAPYWAQKKRVNQKIRFNEELEYPIPSY